MSSDLIKHVTDASFEADVLKSGKPVLVDYWAEWCGPCKAIAPILDELSTQYGDKLQIAKMNVDENQEVPGKFGIRGIPTLMLFTSALGVGSPLGWLWAMMTEAALPRIASLNTSPTRMLAALRLPR